MLCVGEKAELGTPIKKTFQKWSTQLNSRLRKEKKHVPFYLEDRPVIAEKLIGWEQDFRSNYLNLARKLVEPSRLGRPRDASVFLGASSVSTLQVDVLRNVDPDRTN